MSSAADHVNTRESRAPSVPKGEGWAERILYRMLRWSSWNAYHLAFGLQRVEMSSASGWENEADAFGTRPRIYVCWHARILGAIAIRERCGTLHALSMPHRGWGDEGVALRALRRSFFDNLKRKGIRFIELRRGEPRAETVRRLVAHLEMGHDILMTADSARSGAFIAKLGAIQAAAEAGVELVPFSFSSSRKIRFNPLWDNFMVPVPFGRYIIRLGEPMVIKKDMDGEELEAMRQELASRLNALTHIADDLAGIRREYRLLPPGTTLQTRTAEQREAA